MSLVQYCIISLANVHFYGYVNIKLFDVLKPWLFCQCDVISSQIPNSAKL